MPDCHMPFHWPRLDKDLLLCVRITDVRDCMWSGGIRLDDNYSLTINLRDITGKMHFLRVDVVLQETTYFIVFTDADTMPPPIRVDNFSEVPLSINQVCLYMILITQLNLYIDIYVYFLLCYFFVCITVIKLCHNITIIYRSLFLIIYSGL